MEQKTVTIDAERYKSESRLLDLLLSLTSYGSGDLSAAAEWLDEAGLSTDDFGQYVEEWCKDTGSQMAGLDIAALALEFIVQEAGAANLAEYIYGNFMCSDFDIDDDKAGEILYAIPEDEREEAWEFLREFTGVRPPSVAVE